MKQGGEGSEGTNSLCGQLSNHFFPILTFQVATSLPFLLSHSLAASSPLRKQLATSKASSYRQNYQISFKINSLPR